MGFGRRYVGPSDNVSPRGLEGWPDREACSENRKVASLIELWAMPNLVANSNASVIFNLHSCTCTYAVTF